MINAALFTPNLTLGGAERWIVSLAKFASCARLRWTGAIVSGWGGLDEHLCRELAQYVKVHTNDAGWHGQPGARELASSHFHAIHDSFDECVSSACRHADVLVAWGSDQLCSAFEHLSIPRVLTSHTSERPNPLRPISGATHLVAVSEVATEFFRERQGNELPLTVVYNGADQFRCQPQAGRAAQRAAWGADDNEIVLGYLGRYSVEKNPAATIEAITNLPANFKAVFYGSSTPRDQHTINEIKLMARSRAPDRVLFREPVPHVGDVLAGLDVFVLASHREAFSLALIEAWLAGVPVVATPVGSLPELERKVGPLAIGVPMHPSGKQLSAAVRRACGHEGKQIARRAQRLAKAHFTGEAMGQRWVNYLEAVVNGSRHNGRRRGAQMRACWTNANDTSRTNRHAARNRSE
jgi:glycosyltransferase involved in cell wall biosynthesis